MISQIKSQQLIHRDGTSQQDRYLEALHPDKVEIEGRSIEELIREAQRLAREIRFFNEQDQVVSNWEAFFVGDVETYQSSSETKKEIQRQRWARQLAEYVENPMRFRNDAKKLAQLSRPHVVLFLSFLKLLNHVKSQINALPKKHLDFYFLERLGFKPQQAVPDVVNVLLELVPGVPHLEVPKGTVLLAGNDADGNELHYTTDRDTVISAAEVAELKTVFVEKSRLSIEDAHLNNRDDADNGFARMMEMALGSPQPGDPLPALPTGVKDLVELQDRLDLEEQSAQDYVTQQLGFSAKEDFKDFRLVIATHLKDKANLTPVTLQEWEAVYRLLDRAFKQRTKMERQTFLQELHESKGAKGFEDLLEHVFGSPDAGDNLPSYRGGRASILDIRDDLVGPDAQPNASNPAELAKNRQEAVAYIQEELHLTEKDFKRLVSISERSVATPAEWAEVYEMLELANRKVRSIALPSPVREELFNIYAEPDARAAAFSQYGAEEESVRFKTFGGRPAGSAVAMQPAEIGFAISSPIFLLEEGQRTISVLIAFDRAYTDLDKLAALFQPEEDAMAPMNIFLSHAEAWGNPGSTQINVGNYLTGPAESAYTATIADDVVSITAGDDFLDADRGKYLVWTDGTIYEILLIQSPTKVSVRKLGMLESAEQVLKYTPQHLYLNALEVIIQLGEEDLPVLPIDPEAPNPFLQSEFPSLVFALNHALVEQQGKESFRSHYQDLIQLKMEKVQLKVDVSGMRNLSLQNDLAKIDPKKPFEPFGNAPEIGNSFYFANKELSEKRLDALHLDLQWMNTPDDFAAHYQNYWFIQEDDPNLPTARHTIQNDADFQARVFLHDKRATLDMAGIAMFANGGKVSVEGIRETVQNIAPTYRYQSAVDLNTGRDVLDWERYFKLELDHRDFQHATYRSLFGKQALSDKAAIRKMSISTPYTPKLKSLRVGYSSQTEIYLNEIKDEAPDRLYHLHPFGYREVKAGEAPALVPEYKHEGALYIGLDKLDPPQSLSLLFQMSEGSADPDTEKPPVQWCYLQEENWVPLDAGAISSDTTNGLMNTGIVQLELPAEASRGGALLPGQYHWLKVSCDRNTVGISDTIEIRAQAIGATFSSEQVATSHFVDLLPPGSITETLEFSPEIREISQPYTSRKGRPAEQDSAFYNRISERLRHKNRAITMWDYERMVLNQFPEVYKVKCLPAAMEQGQSQLGTVNVLVVPDIKGKLPFNPFEPKVPTDTLFQVQEFLDEHAPAYAEVKVSNPTFLQIMIRCVVKFKAGYNEGFYKPKLIDELKRFLAPWAYDEGGNITIGGTIYASVLVNYIAERPYIEYVANMKLFQSEDGRKFIDVRTVNGGKNMVVATRPDTVLVSAQTHQIDIVDENGYDEDNFEGINYMKVELDFRVGENV